MNRQRLDSPLVYVGAHNVYYVKLPVKVLYFTTAVFRHYMFLIRLFRFSNVLDIRVMHLPWGNIVVEITCKAPPSSYKQA